MNTPGIGESNGRSHGAEPARWQNRIDALKNLPGVMKLVWQTARGLVMGALALRFMVALVPLGILAVSRRIIDTVNIRSGVLAALVANVWPLLWIEFGIAAGGLVLSRAVDYFDARLADQFTHNISLRVMNQAAVLDLSYFEDSDFYDKLERARVQATDRVIILTAIGSLFQRSISLISLAAAVIWYSPWLFGLLFVCVLPVFAGESHFAFAGYSLAHELTPVRRELDYLRVLGCSRESAKEIKMFALAKYLVSRYNTLSEKVIQRNTLLIRHRFFWGGALAAMSACGYYGGYAYLVFQTLDGHISIGTLTLLAGAIAGANGELQTVFSLFSNIAEQSLFLTDLLKFLNQPSHMQTSPKAIPAPRPIRDGLEFRDVSFQYLGSDSMVLKNLNFRIGTGERVALVGENGQGKTTLVKLITRLYDPTNGAIFLDGVNLKDYELNDLRREIGVIFQDFFRYDMAVRENIGVGRVELIQDDEALWAAARRSKSEETISDFPSRLEQMLGRRFEGGVDLSGGQWQRLALARAYLREAQILILDEPTASLDAAAEAEVFTDFAELTKGRIALLISHRFSTVRNADRIIVLSDGQIAEEGPHDDLLAANGIYARLFTMQAANYR
jgi:ATP-binding cassette subfamily B protein